MAGVVTGGDGTGTCSAGFVTQRMVTSFFPFLFLLELASAHFLFFGGAVSVILQAPPHYTPASVELGLHLLQFLFTPNFQNSGR